MFDSFGKPPSGILQGSFLWLGEYNECVNINVKELEFQGKYCRLSNPFAEKLVNIFLLIVFVLFYHLIDLKIKT